MQVCLCVYMSVRVHVRIHMCYKLQWCSWATTQHTTNCFGFLGPRFKMQQMVIIFFGNDSKYNKLHGFAFATTQHSVDCNGVLVPRLKMIQIITVVLCYDLKYYNLHVFSLATIQDHTKCIGFCCPRITIVENVQTHETIQIRHDSKWNKI